MGQSDIDFRAVPAGLGGGAPSAPSAATDAQQQQHRHAPADAANLRVETDCRAELMRIYAAHATQSEQPNGAQLEKMLREWAGREDELLSAVQLKYTGVDGSTATSVNVPEKSGT